MEAQIQMIIDQIDELIDQLNGNNMSDQEVANIKNMIKELKKRYDWLKKIVLNYENKRIL